LVNSGVPVIAGIDTRALVRHLRSRGVMRGVISAVTSDSAKLIESAPQRGTRVTMRFPAQAAALARSA